MGVVTGQARPRRGQCGLRVARSISGRVDKGLQSLGECEGCVVVACGHRAARPACNQHAGQTHHGSADGGDDTQIKQMRKEWEKKAGQFGAGPPGGAGFGTGGRPGGGGSQKTGEEKEKARRAQLDRTSPEERARMDLFRKEMNDRRKQRGLPVR